MVNYFINNAKYMPEITIKNRQFALFNWVKFYFQGVYFTLMLNVMVYNKLILIYSDNPYKNSILGNKNHDHDTG